MFLKAVNFAKRSRAFFSDAIVEYNGHGSLPRPCETLENLLSNILPASKVRVSSHVVGHE